MTDGARRSEAAPELSRTELEDLYAEYAEYLDEGPLERWPTLFAEQAIYRIVTRDNFERDLPLAMILCEGRSSIEDRVYAIANTAFTLPRRTRHLISGIRANRDPAEATVDWMVTANFAVFETLEERHTACHATGRYQDRVTRSAEGRLLFLSKLAICDSALVPNSLVTPL